MEKIKQALSHGARKTLDNTNREGESSSNSPTSPIPPRDPNHRATTGGLTGEGSHLAGASQPLEQKSASTGLANAGEHLPIYNRFTGYGAAAKTVEQAPHFSNTPNLKTEGLIEPPSTLKTQGPVIPPRGRESTPSPTLSPDTTRHRLTVADEMSTASIKSGVIGFPQGGLADSHAASVSNRHLLSILYYT
ncbi:uncharacterized protein BDR25DRAFT_306139 [Lindgomyces ingoldianus]|uniref:Uncharacterized protein n=1 Tax=Lindgomyces ingoldianus TaxID=673940 RepID=A0ACB6QH90_9PLEO|nr:uncharacterized protein BDR25DRAFT_306139 [Lindgomyces ingoldianus]KAF2466291.1 hypothetical protein BDR25DRAFT_306139 [Lindgomyces ingoldianus]